MPTDNDTKQAGRRTEKKGAVDKVGNLTKDPELAFAANGMAYSRFDLAVERPVKAGDWAGERITEFYRCTAFRSLAENVVESLAKGSRVIVIGDAQLEYWTDKEGKEHADKVILANAVGPDLRFATVEIQKVSRSGPKTAEGSEGFPDADEPF